MIYAEKVGDAIELNATYRDKELVRSIPGSRYSSPPPRWTVPLSWTACIQLRGTFGRDGLSIGPELRRWAERELDTRVTPSLAWRERFDVQESERLVLPPPAGRKLRPLQEADVRWMLTTQSGVLMNPVRAGKTISVLTWARNLALERVLVVCPAPMKLEWADECGRWYPELPAVAVMGTAAERRAQIQEAGAFGGLVAITYEVMRTHSRLAPYGQVRLTEAEKQRKDLNYVEWDAIIIDEAHRLADPKSKQTRACWAVGHQQDAHRWALTATPTTKGIDTIWPMLHFADPVEHPSRSKFIDRYAMASMNFWGGVTVGAIRPEMEREFLEIFEPRSRRLPREVVNPQVEPVTRITRKTSMTPEQAAAYAQMKKQCLAELDGGDVVVATSTGTQHIRLSQLASSYAYTETRLVKNKDTGEMEPKVFLELKLPSCKIDALLSDLEDWLAQEETVIVFAASRRLIELTSEVLTKKKIKHAKIVGGQNDMLRHEQKAMFQDGTVDVILVVISAGGSGITLSRATVEAYLQRSWSRVEDQQSEGRGYPTEPDATENILRVDYIAPDTVDVGQLDVLSMKDDNMQQVLRDKELLKKMLGGEHITEADLEETDTA